MYILRHIIQAALVLVLANHIACGQSSIQNRVIKKYSIRDGLSQGVVNCITQDDKGLMWFATEDGLNRFDGYTFKTFKYASDLTSGTADNFIQHIFKDHEGVIWVSSRKGLYKFDQTTERFMLFDFPGDARDVSFITENQEGNIWFAIYGGGFGQLSRPADSITVYSLATLPGLSSNTSIVMLEDSEKKLWIGSQNQGLNVYDVRNKKLVRNEKLSIRNTLPSVYVKSMVEDHLGNVWIATTKGLVAYLRRDNRFHVFDNVPLLSNKGLFTLFFDSNKNLWIGTQGEGVIKTSLQYFDSRSVSELEFEHIRALDQYNIAQHTIRSVYEDKDHNIWLGTHGDGVYFISHVPRKFGKIETKHVAESAESLVPHYGMCYDNEGHLWMGTDGKGLVKATVEGEVIRHYTADGKQGSLCDNVILSALRDHDNNLWFGSFNHGLFRYNKDSDTFTNYNHALTDSAGPLGNQVRLIFEDSQHNIWVGASRGGLCRVSKEEKAFRYLAPGLAINAMDARAIVEDKSGMLWVGGYGDGLRHVDPHTGESKRYFYESEESNQLKNNVVFALALDQQQRLWIGTGGGGLCMYNTQTKDFRRYTEKDGLINNTIYGLLVDHNGNIWMSTNKGISRLDPQTTQFYNYTSHDGLQEGQFNPGSALHNPDEQYMCFGGTLGVNLFYPEEVTNEFGDLDIMISGFQLFNKPVEINGEEYKGVLKKVVSETEEITLKHDQSVFTFEFVAINYNSPERTRYAYKLEGLENDWNYVNDQRMATYRYLSPGSYTFKVKATNRDNVWPEEYAQIRLTVLPPFWKTPYAYALYVMVMTIIFYAVWMVRKKESTLRKRLRSEKAQRKRERQLVQEKLSFFTEVSHEFRTPLTLMIGPLEDMIARESRHTPAGKKLKLVYRNAHKLLHLINMLLDYRKIESGKMILKAQEDNMVAFVEEIFISFRELAEKKHIHFHLHADQPAINVWFDKEKMEMVLNNILSNSFKYIGKGNEISVSISVRSSETHLGHVRMEISDNGVGIPKEQLPYIFDWFYQGNNNTQVSSGIGLALAKKLIHLHKGHIFVESTDKGTVFIIEVPLGKDHLHPHDLIHDKLHNHLVLDTHRIGEYIYAQAPDEEDTSHKKGLKTIVLVEDDDEIRTFLKEYLEKDYKLLEAVNGEEARQLVLNQHADLIVSDVMMPIMNGIDLCKEVKSNIKTSHIPVVLLTAKTSMTHHKEGLETGADAYITKPFSPEMLALTIHNLLQAQENLKRFYRNIFATSQENTSKKGASLDEKFLRQVFDTLKANLDNPQFNLDELCETLGISRSLLYKKIKSLTGQSPVEYLRTLRLQEAARLLKTGQYKVFEVVYLVGFTDLKYFRQCFIKEFGYPPSEIIEK